MEDDEFDDIINGPDRKFTIEDYNEYRAGLPFQMRSETVKPDSAISDSTARCNSELFKVAGATLENIRHYLAVSKKSNFNLYTNVNLRDYRVNAFANLLDENTGIFSLNAGVYFAIADACSTVIHRPEFMEDYLPNSKETTLCFCCYCGGPRHFDTWLTDYSWLATDPSSEPFVWNPMVVSTTETPRAVVGGFLILRCLFWMCAHEIGHLLLDHLQVLDSKVYSEIGGEFKKSKQLRQHIIELEADTFATCIDLNIAGAKIDLEQRFEEAKKTSTYKGPWPEVSGELVTRLLGLVPVIVGTILCRVSGTAASDSHPSPIHRFYFSSQSFTSLLARRNLLQVLGDVNRLRYDALVISHVCLRDEQKIREWTKGSGPGYKKLTRAYWAFEDKYGTLESRLQRVGLFESWQEKYG